MEDLAARLGAQGVLAPEAARRIAELESRAHLPLAREIHALLYLGAALILAGVGATVKDRLEQLGPAAILALVGSGAAFCYAYCFRAGRPFTPGRVEAPSAAFDYVLYLACGLTGIFFSYLEWKWKLLGSWWDLYLFGSGLLFAALAYRFDNRLVLATGLLNLAAALGQRTSFFIPSSARHALAAYGAALVGLSFAARGGEIKPHFEDSYLTLGVHIAFMALLSGSGSAATPEFWLLLVSCGALGAWSLRERRFDTFAAAVGYAYVASLRAFLRAFTRYDGDLTLWIVVLSAAGVLAVLLWARSRFKQAAS